MRDGGERERKTHQGGETDDNRSEVFWFFNLKRYMGVQVTVVVKKVAVYGVYLGSL